VNENGASLIDMGPPNPWPSGNNKTYSTPHYTRLQLAIDNMAAEKEKEDKDELEALDALEKEASEFNKVRPSSALSINNPPA